MMPSAITENITKGKNNNCNTTNEDEDAIERKYERFRDEQTNTGVIAALLGGFALTNSWELELSDRSTNDLKTIDLAAYCLAIMAVHCCTCSALISAFLYRTLTQQPNPRRGVAWVERHSALVAAPWIKFLLGTLCYICNVCLVAWSTLEISVASRVLTLVAGMTSCTLVAWTGYTIVTDNRPPDGADPKSSSSSCPKKFYRKQLWEGAECTKPCEPHA